MRSRLYPNPIIQTATHTILKHAATAAMATAQLAIARGAAGIGKSFALTLVADLMSQVTDDVYLVTATARNGRSIKRFFEDAVLEIGIMGNGGTDPMQRLERALMASRPFRPGGPRILLVVDECQHLDGKVIECLRALFDNGRMARDFDPHQPAFGMLLVGNGHFLSRGGKAERAAFEALLSRCPIEVTLDRPTADEIRAFANAMFPDSPDLQAALAQHGQGHGNLRVMDTAMDLARLWASDDAITLDHLRTAFSFSAGGK
jgi:type II secretory pathway predicted ATPase ExeA